MPSLDRTMRPVGASLLSAALALFALGCGSDAVAPVVDDPGPTLGEGPFEGLFVAAGDDRLLFSEDGVTWLDVDTFGTTALALEGRKLVDVAATRRQLVVTDVNQGEISRFQGEPDRIDVMARSTPLYALATDQTSFLALGLRGIYGSADGLDFALLDTNLGFPVAGLEVAPNLVFGRGRYVAILTFRDSAVQFRMGIATSVDGTQWEATNAWARLGFHVDLIQDDLGFAALGTRGPPEDAKRVVWTSADGLSWSEHWLGSDGGPTPRTLARAPGGRIVVLGGSSEGIYRWYSDDGGGSWTGDGVLSGGIDAPLDMLYAEGGFLAVLESGRIATSVDGEEWTTVFPAGVQGGALRSIHYVK